MRSTIKSYLHRLRALRWLKSFLTKNPDHFLFRVHGVIHVGANIGQERVEYDFHRLKVLWIEPIPEIFSLLQKNIAQYRNQRAVCCLLTDQIGKEYEFHISNNEGASSSIFNLKAHKDIWPDVAYEKSISLKSTTLDTILEGEDKNAYQALILDTQGSELLVLKGAENSLNCFSYIKLEVADFESYEGCCQLAELQEFMKERKFIECSRRLFAKHPSQGNYYDICFRRIA